MLFLYVFLIFELLCRLAINTSTILLLNFAILAVTNAIQVTTQIQIKNDFSYLYRTPPQFLKPSSFFSLTTLLLIFKYISLMICTFLFIKLFLFSEYKLDRIKKSTNMTDCGYDKKRFPNLTNENLDCPICTNVVIFPKECSGCGDLFCGKCIDDWIKKANSCPKRCNGLITNMTSKALIKIYNDLDIRCSYCQKVMKLYDLTKHQNNCRKTKCWNFQICFCYQQDKNKYGVSNCSEQCQVLDSIVKTGGNMKKMYEILIKIKPNNESNSISIVSNSLTNSLRWDEAKCGLGIQFQNKCELVMLKQQAYVFRTVIGSTGFTSGLHYWEIVPDLRTENELKVGVVTSAIFDFNTAFCDHIFGYAYYGLGQLRQNSNASGSQYGKRMKKQGVLGVFLNMDKGQVSFSLNGQNMGVAFDNEALKKGPIYPAVALLHCAGCSIRGELPIPHCFR